MNCESASPEEVQALREIYLKIMQCLHEAEFWEDELRPYDKISRQEIHVQGRCDRGVPDPKRRDVHDRAHKAFREHAKDKDSAVVPEGRRSRNSSAEFCGR